MINLCYFSPTGNVAHLTNLLATHIGEDVTTTPIEFTAPHTLSPCDHLVILFSIHGFNTPRTVKRFVKELPQGVGSTISIIAVGCSDIWLNSAASLGIRKILEKKGCHIAIDTVLAMPLTLVMDFPEELKKKTIAESKKKLVSIARRIKANRTIKREVPFKSRVVSTVGKIEDGAARLFGLELFASKKCTSCGICVVRCPEKNIHLNIKSHPKFGFSCLMCLRCIYECPEKAIKPLFSRFIPIKNGYTLD